MRISDWSSDVCSSDLAVEGHLTAVEIVYIVSSLLNVAYLLPIVARGFFLPASNPATGPVARSVGAAAAPVAGGIREAPFLCVLPPCLTALGCFVLFFSAYAVIDLLRPIVTEVPPCDGSRDDRVRRSRIGPRQPPPSIGRA